MAYVTFNARVRSRQSRSIATASSIHRERASRARITTFRARRTAYGRAMTAATDRRAHRRASARAACMIRARSDVSTSRRARRRPLPREFHTLGARARSIAAQASPVARAMDARSRALWYTKIVIVSWSGVRLCT